MSKDAVLKARGESYDAALRFARAGQAVEEANKALEHAQLEYQDAGQAMRASRSTADATEANAVADEVKGARDVNAAIDAVAR
jgi:hypothetical protein